MLLKQQLVGQFGLILGICVLGTACIGGEISDSTGGPRFEPGPSDPVIGNDGSGDPSGPQIAGEESPLVCPGANADLSASSGWRSSEASQPASGALRFELKARPTSADLNGLVAVGAQEIDAFSKAAIAVRFAEDGFVDARDGGIYDSDVSYPYDPGVWYDITVTADVQSETYDVEIGPCGEPKQMLIDNASFRDDASASEQLSGWGVWSSQSAALEVSTPAWMASGGCAPSTCETLGNVCGQPSDGCGGVLSCGTCSSGETCSSGACVDASVPPPPCQPATCQTLNAECGQQSNGCGGFLSCGTCSTGQMCSGGSCIQEPAPPPPCQPATCQTLSAECGVQSDGCGGTLSCGTCNAGNVCTSGTCSSPGVTGVPYGHVTPADVGVTLGVGVVSAIPTVAYSGSSSPAAGALIENVIISNTMYIGNPNITFRNVIFNCEGNFYCIYINGDAGEDSSGLTVEYSKLSAFDSDVKLIRSETATAGGPLQNYQNLTVRNCELSGGHDWMYFDGDIDGLLIENNWFHTTAAAGGRHADGFQIGEHPEFGETRGTLTFRGNYFDKDTNFDAMNALLFMTGSSSLNNTTVYFESNHVGEWGWSTLWCEDSDACIFRYNVWEQAMKTALPAPGLPSHAIWFDDGGANWGPPSEVTCERYEDGTFLENAYIRGADNTTTGCPSYTP